MSTHASRRAGCPRSATRGRASGVGVPTVHASAGPCNATVSEKFKHQAVPEVWRSAPGSTAAPAASGTCGTYIPSVTAPRSGARACAEPCGHSPIGGTLFGLRRLELCCPIVYAGCACSRGGRLRACARVCAVCDRRSRARAGSATSCQQARWCRVFWLRWILPWSPYLPQIVLCGAASVACVSPVCDLVLCALCALCDLCDLYDLCDL